jgi:hypothetical protein
MKTYIRSALLVSTAAVLAGCACLHKGAAYNHEPEFRRQLAESIPVRDFGYTIKDLMFTEDYQKALVIFSNTNSKARPNWEFTLDSNGFRRYRGYEMQPFYTPGTANTPQVVITVILPQK